LATTIPYQIFSLNVLFVGIRYRLVLWALRGASTMTKTYKHHA